MAALSPPIDGGTVLLTGASSGIGRELARLLAPRADRLILVARRGDRLRALADELGAAGARVDARPVDVGDQAALAVLLGDVGPVDVVINNAGLGAASLFERADWARVEEMVRTNVLALLFVTHRVLGPMVERRRGGILQIGSAAGLAVLPGSAAYAGTKWFVHGFTEALRAEMAGTGVVVTEACPGPVDTEFDEVAGPTAVMPGTHQFLRLSARRCAAEVLRGFDAGRPVVLPGWRYRALMRAQALAPLAPQRLVARASGRRLRHAGR